MAEKGLSVPVLHGLTHDQLEATRGYVEAATAVTTMFLRVEELRASTPAGERPPLAFMRPLVVQTEALRELERDDDAYGHGVKYALSSSAMSSKMFCVEAALEEWRTK